ncbi:ACP S-malonyltransferase [Candidatus Saccharibacteria bacterium]|nr:ACP S-malonyltransferase [Candidatus Saccharibacteria bacterium]
MKKAWMFSGQGTQEVGMARELMDAFPEFLAVITRADRITGRPISGMMRNGPKEFLDRTSNTQIAVVAVSLGLLAVYRKRHKAEIPDYVIGHSVGEGAAAVAADAIDEEDALAWVNERGLTMEEEGKRHPGKMAAILGLKDAVVERITANNGSVVANYNIPDQQIVVSGGNDEVDRTIEEANEEGARRTVVLGVTIPAHSPLMSGGIERVARFMNSIRVKDPSVPIAANIGRIITLADQLKDAYPNQLKLPVRWSQSVEELYEAGVRQFREFGHGDVLSSMVKRQLKDKGVHVEHAEDCLKR